VYALVVEEGQGITIG
jgi:hypothetical protein